MATRSQALAMTQGIPQFASGYQAELATRGTLADAYFITGDPVPVGLNFEYVQFDRGDGVTIPDTKSSISDPVGAILAFGGSKVTGTLDYHVATTEYYDATDNVSDVDLLLQLQSGARMANQALAAGRFQRILSAASTAAGAGTNISVASADPIDLIQTAAQEVMLACGGYCNVRILIGATAFRKIAATTKFQGRINGGATVALPSTPTDQQMAAAIGMNVEVKTTLAVYNSAAVGQTVSNAFLLGDTIYVAAVSPSPTTQDPSALKVFNGAGGNGLTPTFFRSLQGQHEAANWRWAEKVVATNSSAIKKLNVVA